MITQLDMYDVECIYGVNGLKCLNIVADNIAIADIATNLTAANHICYYDGIYAKVNSVSVIEGTQYLENKRRLSLSVTELKKEEVI